LATIDWIVVASYVAISIGVGIFFSRRAGRSLQDYFLSGRSLPWWLLGTSMVATTFAADTPLAITEYVREDGVWRNWFWWTLAISHVLAAVAFSRLWRRAGVLTDNELIELRYSGKPAAFLRGFKAVYFSTLYNFIVMAWVTAAMSTVLSCFLDIPISLAVVACIAIALIYSLLGGFWGVVITDLIQFCVAMVGSVVFAWLAVDHVGGMDALIAKLGDARAESLLAFVPGPSAPAEVWYTFAAFVGLIWWSSHNADGGGYLIQRMMSAKNEKHALIGTFWFALAHYVLRMWPWVVVALVSLVMFPELGTGIASHKEAYPATMAAILPAGLRGVFVAVFLAAYMSTVDTHLNWGASYIVNDLYKRFMRPDATQRHYVLVSKLTMVALAIVAGVVAMLIDSITGAWEFVWAMGAGVGGVLILRWFWWRINAWSEISALGTSLVLAVGLQITSAIMGEPIAFHIKALVVVGGSLSVWIPVTLLTRPEPPAVIERFCKRVRPGGFWPVRVHNSGLGRRVLAAWLGGVMVVYGGLFSVGSLVMVREGYLAWTLGMVAVGSFGVWYGLRGSFDSDTGEDGSRQDLQ
jgi:SSS family solute:Na+ symporter